MIDQIKQGNGCGLIKEKGLLDSIPAYFTVNWSCGLIKEKGLLDYARLM